MHEPAERAILDEVPMVEACVDVRAFFREQVTSALRSLEVTTARDTEQYLVELLAGFSVSDKVQDVSTPFVELLGHALEVEGAERMYRLRNLGDAALYVSGFLPDSYERRGVTHPYVVSMGARAYGEVSRSARWHSAAHRFLFEELADRFEAFARVLDEVREQTALCTDGEIFRLYERWCATRSPSLLRRLSRRGVAPRVTQPVPGPSDRGPQTN